MGWNSWNCFRGGTVSATGVVEVAQAIVDTGLRDAGYEYVVVDDHWQASRRTAAGALVADPTRFPDGIEAVADAVHALGLKFGIYSVPGSVTCGMYYDGYPADGIGSLGHEALDAETFATSGVDYLKYDWCRAHLNDGLRAQTAFRRMADELRRTGRDIVYSISEYGLFQPWLWAPEFAQMWRTTDDLHEHWWSLAPIISQMQTIAHSSRPGAWNDPDMLQVGNGTLTPAEMRTHLSVWAILNAPLMAGHDVRTMTDEVRAMLLNPSFLRIDQDWGGAAGSVIARHGVDIWAKPMSTGGSALALVNMREEPITVDVREHVTDDLLGPYADAWTGQPFAEGDLAAVTVDAHDSLLLEPRNPQ